MSLDPNFSARAFPYDAVSNDDFFNLPFSDSEYTNTDIFLNYFCFIL